MGKIKSSSKAYGDLEVFGELKELSLKIDDRVEKGLFYWIIGGAGGLLALKLGWMINLNSSINAIDKERGREISSVKEELQAKLHKLEILLLSHNKDN